MEPVGASASILTLLGATGESCKFIYNLYVDLSDAPKDIQTQTKKFQSFNLTIQQLIVAYEKLPSDFEVDIRLQKEIATFQIEVTSMKIRLERRFDAMRQSRSLRWKECCKWLLFDRQLNKFLNTMDHWYMIMNQAATIAQIALSTRIDQNVSTLMAQTHPWMSCPSTSRAFSSSVLPLSQLPYSMKLPSEHQMDTSRLAQYLALSAEPVGLKPLHWGAIRTGKLAVGCVSGLIVSRCWSLEGQEKYKALRASEGFGIEFKAQSSQLISGSLSILMFATYAASNSWKLNLKFSLRWVGLFHFGGPHHMAIQKGDKDYFMEKFSSGVLGVADATSNGDTLLHIAAGYNQSGLVDMLVEQGADANATNNHGETPLHISLRVGKEYECARRLLRHGADLQRGDKDGRTPLHSFFNNAIRQVLYYHSDDIDVSSQDTRGMTVSHWASWTSQSCPNDILYPALAARKTYFPLAAVDIHGKSVLHFAAERGNTALVQYLLSHPQAAAMAAPDYKGRSLLHYATASTRFPLVYSLVQTLRLGTKETDHKGMTILHHAVMKRNLAVVEYILTLDSDLVHCQDSDGRTPLELARLHQSALVVDVLQPYCNLRVPFPLEPSNKEAPPQALDENIPGRCRAHNWKGHSGFYLLSTLCLVLIVHIMLQ